MMEPYPTVTDAKVAAVLVPLAWLLIRLGARLGRPGDDALADLGDS